MFTLKTFTGKHLPQPNRIFILNKGKNSGKPSRVPFTNCYCLEAVNMEQAEEYFNLCFGLWKCRKLLCYLKGSVIDYITIDDLRSAIGKAERNIPNLNLFSQHVKVFNNLDKQIKLMQDKINLCNEYKVALLSKHL